MAPAYLSGEYTTVRVTIESLAPEEGTILTPFWVAFHDGRYDTHNNGGMASAALEAMAEDGDMAGLRSSFAASGAGTIDGVLTGLGMEGTPPLFFPGQSNSWTVSLDGSDPGSAYFSYAAMILPSNDAFVANADPMAVRVFDESGNFHPREITITGIAVRDAGTEVNDEVPEHVPVLGQMMPDTGTTEDAPIGPHPGFQEGGPILAAFPRADFTADGYAVARITIEEVPARRVTLKLTIENTAPETGTLLTPFWLGFHDGSLDLFNPGEPASLAMERMAEDGNLEELRMQFVDSGTGQTDGVLTGLGMEGTPPLFFPGQSNYWMVTLNAHDPRNRYLSYAAMILPSNDAFVANEGPTALELFSADGTFQPVDREIPGSAAWDAGTEVNDEIATSVPVLGQMTPDTGMDEGGTVASHPGFLPAGNVLNAFPEADFTQAGYAFARLTVKEVANPFADLLVEDNGYRVSPVFGMIDDAHYPFLRHETHGWLSVIPPESGSAFWAYNYEDELGWVFIDLDLYPLLYHADKGYLFYLPGTAQPRLFYDFRNRTWFSKPGS